MGLLTGLAWADDTPQDMPDGDMTTYQSPVTPVGATYPDYVVMGTRPAVRRSYGGGSGGDDSFDDDEGFDDDYDPYTEEPGQLPIGDGISFLLICGIGYAMKQRH